MTLTRNLELLGYRVELAEDGEQALRMVAEQEFDLLLLDILMPKLDGFQVLARLQENGVLTELPVIVISALEDMDSVVRGIEMGAEDFLPKPFDPTLLRARIGASLEKRRLRAAEKAVIEREYRTAAGIQRGILPKQLPVLTGWRFGAAISPARQVGGDFYDFIQIDQHKLGIVVGDVSDKGFPAALVMAMYVALMRSEARHESSPARLLQITNRRLMEMNPSSGFITLLYGILDARSGTFAYARAGHHLPLIVHADGTTSEPGSETGQPLGLFDDPLIDEQTLQIDPADSIVLYTDGVQDATDHTGETFGEQRLRSWLGQEHAHPPQELCDLLIEQLIEYQQPHGQFDDMTLLAFRSAKEVS
jgi:sigma-B regulation protein RsbU (phosphoserine phosphatase)